LNSTSRSSRICSKPTICGHTVQSIERSYRIQEPLGFAGVLGTYVAPFGPYTLSNYDITLKVCPLLPRDHERGMTRSDYQPMVAEALVRYLGLSSDRIRAKHRDLRNPIVWLREAIGGVLLCLQWVLQSLGLGSASRAAAGLVGGDPWDDPASISAEVRERAVRMVFDQSSEHPSQWAAIRSVGEKLGLRTESLRRWVRQAERDTGQRPGLTTSEREERLQRENFELKRANEILREGVGVFAQAELDHRPK